MNRSLLKSLFILLLLTACDSGSTISSYYSFPEQTWKRFDNPIIEINIAETGIFYNMFVELEYVDSLASKLFPVTVIMSTPSGEVRSRDIIFQPDPDHNISRMILRKEFAFSEKGICTFEIENRSQYVETKGIRGIGVVIEKMD